MTPIQSLVREHNARMQAEIFRRFAREARIEARARQRAETRDKRRAALRAVFRRVVAVFVSEVWRRQNA